MNRPTASERNDCTDLANVLSKLGVERAVNLLSRVGIYPLPDNVRAGGLSDVRTADGERIGIWQRSIDGDRQVYSRIRNHPDDRLWAATEQFDAHVDRPRVILLGESVARGFFHDPSFNPTIALRQMFDEIGLTSLVDILDFACISIDLESLLALAESAVAIRPSAFVIFAGNNWHPFNDMKPQDLRELGRSLRQIEGGGAAGEYAAVRDYMNMRAREKTRGFLKRIGKLCRQHSIPAVFVLPDFNLTDWRDCTTEYLPSGFERDAACWFSLRDQAESARLGGDMPQVRRLAAQLVAMDGGATATGLRLAAWAVSERDNRTARKYLEQARDAVLSAGWSAPNLVSARCYAAVQATVRTEARDHGIDVIDLPEHFDSYLGNELPGRNLFLDHCHINVTATRLAMSRVGEWVIDRLGYSPVSSRRLADTPRLVSLRDLANAHILAAYFNATRGQPTDIVAFHCKQAMTYDPDTVADLTTLAVAEVQELPLGMTSGFDSLIKRRTWSTRFLFLAGHPLFRKKLHWNLLEAIGSGLSDSERVKDILDGELRRLHAVDDQLVDLLDFRYCLRSGYDLEQNARIDRAYHRSMGRRSSFVLVCREPHALSLHLVSRLGETEENTGSLALYVNRTLVDRFTVSSRWQTRRIPVDRSLLSAGINQIVIEWPDVVCNCVSSGIATNLVGGRWISPFPCYGELCRFTAERAPGDQASIKPIAHMPASVS